MSEPTVVVGIVTKAHGLRGEVAVQSRSDNPDRFAVGSRVTMSGGRTLTVASVHEHGKVLLVGFEEVLDRTAAEALRGSELMIPRSSLPPLAEGEYWPHDLEGCRVFTESGAEVGVLTEVVPGRVNDLWVATDAAGNEALLPAVHAVIAEVDPAQRRIVVREIPGLTVPDDEA